jgi:lipid-A-disaccharide synthase
MLTPSGEHATLWPYSGGVTQAPVHIHAREKRPTPKGGALLFTAFEPSGDDHASAVIAELKARHPDLPIYAWGGPKMERAGAVIVERTGDDAVMGMPGFKKILEHHRINERIEEWIKRNKPAAHIPVDSPAANTPIAEIAKHNGCRVVHLVAPQIWAWGRWRIHKLRRITDLVLCMLPFEEVFFTRRRVPARFIGHFLFDKKLDFEALDRRGSIFGDGSPRVAMMPGSRPDELARNFPILLDAYAAIKKKHPGAVGVVAATSDRVAAELKKMAEASPAGWPESLRVFVQDTDAIVRWCSLALVKSGTVTMQVAKQNKPMVVFYKKSNPLFYLMAKTVLSTKMFSLPNVLARKRIVPEFIPHFGGASAIVRAAEELLSDPVKAEKQRREMAEVLATFSNRNAAAAAADGIEEVVGIEKAESVKLKA